MRTHKKMMFIGFLGILLTVLIVGGITIKMKFKLIEESVSVDAYSLLNIQDLKPFNEGMDFRSFDLKIDGKETTMDEFESYQDGLAQSYDIQRVDGVILVDKALSLQKKEGLKSYLVQIDVKAEALPTMEVKIHDKLVEDQIEVSSDTQLEDIQVSAVRSRFDKPYIDESFGPVTMDIEALQDGENIINIRIGSNNQEVTRQIIVDRVKKTPDTVNQKPDETSLKPDKEKPKENSGGKKTALHMNTPYIYINRDYGMPADYVPQNLVEFPRGYAVDTGFRGVKEMVDAFVVMVDAMEKETGNRILNTSSYRPYSSQERLYNNYVAQHGQKEADRISAKPGHSEHQTGLVVDVVTPNGSMWTFGETPQSQWINQNAHRYGFIVRYPEGKEHITKYAFEAWHLRYVGKEYAQKVFDTKLTFDEVMDH